ncbi:MAG TPA: nitroreductase family protein [Candidatus Binataceae bacterium]|nr:nitroreductase family protein [Candidatus Binataceae bacterium]
MHGHPEFDLFEAIYTTRAMRRLKPDPVPREVIMKVIEAATLSPSNSNRQPWIFLVVTDPDIRRFVAERYKQAWDTHYFTPEKRQFLETRPAAPEARDLRSANYLANHIGEAPALIFACVKRYTDPLRKGRPMLGSIYPAVQNLCLAARAYGLGTAITGLHKDFEVEINQRLGVPVTHENEVLIPIGYPKGRWGRPVRKPAAEVTFFDNWGQRQ